MTFIHCHNNLQRLKVTLSPRFSDLRKCSGLSGVFFFNLIVIFPNLTFREAVTHFLRPEDFLPRGVRIQSMPRGPAPQREPMGLCLSVFDYLIQSSLLLRTFRSDVSLFRSRPTRPQILLRGERDGRPRAPERRGSVRPRPEE